MSYLLKKKYKDNLCKFISQKYFTIVFSTSFLVLLSAYTLEFFFNYPPCKLCIYQRMPYFILIVLSLMSLKRKYVYELLWISFTCFVAGFIISGFHSLIERNLIDFEIGCTSSGKDFENIEDLRNFLEKTPITKCDEIPLSVLGFSLANMNLIISTILIILCLYVLKNYEKKTSRQNR